jgi:hypothetical protein
VCTDLRAICRYGGTKARDLLLNALIVGADKAVCAVAMVVCYTRPEAEAAGLDWDELLCSDGSPGSSAASSPAPILPPRARSL